MLSISFILKASSGNGDAAEKVVQCQFLEMFLIIFHYKTEVHFFFVMLQNCNRDVSKN